MKITTIIGCALLCCGMLTANGQTESSVAPKKQHRWVVYGGIGPNVYLNNLQVAADKVKPVNYSFVARLMWEPEYFLSLGFETGYNQLYRMSGTHPTTGDVSIVNASIPIQFVVSMKFLKGFYWNFGMGQAFLMNNVSTQNLGNFDASVVSLGDFTTAVGYRKDISERFTLGVEFKGYYSGKLEDKNLALVCMAGYRLW